MTYSRRLRPLRHGPLHLATPAVWLLYVTSGLAALGLYFVLPATAQDWAYELIGGYGVAGVVAGVAMQRPARRTQWLLIAAGLAVEVVGDLIYTIGERGPHSTLWLADACYLIGPLAMAIGLAGLTPAPPRLVLTPQLLDAALVAVAIGILGWTLVVGPNIDTSAGWPAVVLACLQPSLDLLLLAVLVRQFFSGAARSPSFVLLGIGFVGWLVSDFWFIGTSLADTYTPGTLLDAGWLLGFLCIGTAALHPSLPRLVAAPATEELSPVRFLIISASLGVPVTALALAPVRGQQGVLTAIVGSTVIVALILARLFASLRRSGALLLESEAWRAQVALEAATDPLTGLPNRRTLFAAAERALESAAPVALLFLDLDAFKQVNDMWGHETGDRLIVEVARRIAEAAPAGTIVGRLGGDEFGVLLPDVRSSTIAEASGNAIVHALRPDFSVAGSRVRIRGSVGIATRAGGDVETLAREADVAMYEAKRAGGDRIEVHRRSHDDVVLGYRLASELDHALEHDELRLWYQPIFDLATGRLTGAEALVRWQHPERGLLAPADFVPLAELTRRSASIDEWVLDQAASDIARWRSAGTWETSARVHVNVSPQTFTSLALVDALSSAISGYGLSPSDLVVELTESATLDSPEIAATLRALHDYGVGLALDDLGTGYAVLAALAALPFDVVKLDRSLLPAAHDRGGMRLFEGVLRLIEGMELTAVAEGIETSEQLNIVRRLGCQYAQGYLFARPMPGEAFAAFDHRRGFERITAALPLRVAGE